MTGSPKGALRTALVRVLPGLLLMASGCVVWLLTWQTSGVADIGSYTLRIFLAALGPFLLIVGIVVLHPVVDPAGRGWFLGSALVLGLVATLVEAYGNSVLTVYPAAGTVDSGTVVLLTARPVTFRERLAGRRSVRWYSSDSSMAQVSLGPDSSDASSVLVRARRSGRATIYAIRGTALSQARIAIRDSERRIPPRCSRPSGTSASAAVSSPTGGGLTSRAGLSSTPASVSGRSGSVQTQAAGPATALDTATARLQVVRCLSGTITSPDGQPLPRVQVTLIALRPNGDTAWRQFARTEDVDGRYEFLLPQQADRALDSLSYRVRVGNQVVENRHVWFIPTQWGLDTASRDVSSELLREDTNRDLDISLAYSPHSAFFTLLLLLPAIVGLLSTVIFRHFYSEDETSQSSATNWRKYLLFYYVLGNATVWGITLAIYAWSYAFRRIETISVFSSDLSIPVLAPAFAFLGVLVYATYVLSQHATSETRPERVQRKGATMTRMRRRPDWTRRRLLAIGNRIVVAPYVAIIAVLLLDPAQKTNRQIPFLCFFTGLWIEPVLRLLKAIGDRLTISGDSPGKASGAASASTDVKAPANTRALQARLPRTFTEQSNDTDLLVSGLPASFSSQPATQELVTGLPAEPKF